MITACCGMPAYRGAGHSVPCGNWAMDIGPFFAELAKYGLAGLFIAYLIAVNYLQGRRHDDLTKRFEAIQEKRAEEREKNAAMLAAAAEANRELAQAVQHQSAVIASFSEKITSALIDRGRP